MIWACLIKSIRFVYLRFDEKIKQKEVRFNEANCESDSFTKNHDNIIETEETSFMEPF